MNYLIKLLRNTVNERRSVFLSYFYTVLIILLAFVVRVYFDEAFGDRYFVTYILAIPAIAIIFGYGPGVLAVLLSFLLAFTVQPSYISHSFTRMNSVMAISGLVYLSYVAFLLLYIRHTISKNRETVIQKVRAVEEIIRDQKQIISLSESAMERANDVIIIAEAVPTMSVVYVNKAFTALTGYSSEEILGNTPKILHGPKTDRNSLLQIRQAMQNGKPIRKDILNYKKNGTEFWVELDISPIYDAANVVTHWVSIQREITERKEYEASLLWGQKQAMLALEARSLFIAKMSHEIRTPMTGILGMSTLALRQEDPIKAKTYLDSIHESSLALMKVLNDILDFSKLESGFMALEIKPFKLDSLVSDTQKLFSDAANLKCIQLNCSFSGEENTLVMGDRFRLTQVIGNLVGNAIKFTEKGAVDFALNVLSQDASHIRIQIIVKDTGIGIPEHAHNQIMASFAQADSSLSRRFGGTGLGLSIASELLIQMNSELLFKSLHGVGSQFYFSLDLPMSKINSQTEPFVADSSAGYLGDNFTYTLDQDLAGKNILLAEDNLINQMVVTEVLQAAKAKIYIANNGLEALNLLKDHLFDAILMDIQMPQLDGYETTRQIRLTEAGASIPIIGISAGVSEAEIANALDIGMDDFLPKPLDLDAVVKVLIKHINKS